MKKKNEKKEVSLEELKRDLARFKDAFENYIDNVDMEAADEDDSEESEECEED